MDLENLIQNVNIAAQLDEKLRNEIGEKVINGYDIDEQSRSDWLKALTESLKLATQVKEQKSWPWQNASNIKYPLLSIASLQFQARAYQTLIPDTSVVKGRVVGNDPTGEKATKASRISQFMSYQLLEQIENWEDDMDKLCLVLPICGTAFKKIYYDGYKPCIELLLPDNVCINYYAKSIDTAPRISEIIDLSVNEVITKIRRGEFLDEPEFLIQEAPSTEPNEALEGQGIIRPETAEDSEVPVTFIEQHTWWDLDEDGYKEPYVIVVHKDSKKVARISPRFRSDAVERNEDGDIVEIKPISYYEHYVFVPNPVSGIYGIGFGLLLGPINEAVNSLINQLVDSGTLNNLPSGFLGRGIRLMGGNYRFAPGEFKMVQSTADDIKKGVYQFDFKPPSPVLFNLLGTLISSGQNLASVTDTMLGEQPGQNTPFSTTQEVLSQGLKVYSSIMKRIHRSLKKELKKLYKLNKYTITEDQYFTILDHSVEVEGQPMKVSGTDFEGDDTDVIPASDPALASDVQKLRQSQVIASVLQFGTINPAEASRRILEAERIPDVAKLMEMPPPQPNFDQQIKMEELELKKKELEIDSKIEQFKVAAEAAKDQAEAYLKQVEAQQMGMQAEVEKIKGQYELQKKEMEMQLQMLKSQTEVMKIEAMQAKTEMMKQQSSQKPKKYNKETKSFED